MSANWRAMLLLAAIWPGQWLRADVVELRDGTVLEGAVIQLPDTCWVRTPDGKTRAVPSAEVKAIRSAASELLSGNPEFLGVKRQADAADTPLAALALWQKYLESATDATDRAAAQAQIEKWSQLAEDDAERINGRWVGGQQRRELMASASKLAAEAAELIAANQTVGAMKKLREAVRIYPNSYQAIFALAYLTLMARDEAGAIRYFEQGLRLRPQDPDALNNLGIALLARREHARALDLVCQAAEISDNRVVAQNLVNLVAIAPEQVRSSARFRVAEQASRLLAGKYNLTSPTRNYLLIPPRSTAHADEDYLAGVRAIGSGFVVAGDGLILTNRHVVEGSQAILVILPDNMRRSAEVVRIDDELDLALIRVKTEQQLTPVVLSGKDIPAEGTQCYVMGYPLANRLGSSVKITQGIISGRGRSPLGVDLVVDATVNPGNSGGPLADSRGQVIGIVTMKSRATATEDSYGLAISVGQVRRFLQRSGIQVRQDSGPGVLLNAEQVAARLKPSTVCIFSVR